MGPFFNSSTGSEAGLGRLATDYGPVTRPNVSAALNATFSIVAVFTAAEAAHTAYLAYPPTVRFWRRRATLEGMPSASRYFATVLRAMSMPEAFNFSTRASSLRMEPATS